jgi:hypothetical protein
MNRAQSLGFIFIISLLGMGRASAQTDFEKFRQQRQEAFNQLRAQSRQRFDDFHDSLNQRYADFLEQSWKRFALMKAEPPIKNPIVVPPEYDEAKPQPVPEEIPVPVPPIAPTPTPEPVTPVVPEEKPTPPPPAPPATVNAEFFGTNIRLSNLSFATARLSGVAEKAIADYWRSLSKIPHREIVVDVARITSELDLNDWGLYHLLGRVFKTYAPHGTENERVVFSVFMLNQMGYQAKIGRSGNDLLPMIAFVNNVMGCAYFQYGSSRYYAINPGRKDIQSVEACALDYADELGVMSLNIAQMPKFASSPITKDLKFADEIYALKVNKNVTDFYKDYPYVEFSTYADAPLDPVLLSSVETEMIPHLLGGTQEEIVNWLLHFVQKAFEYKTDGDQFGYEKYFFAEETIASSYSDCEDRSILFAQLVRKLLEMPVVLVYYPGVHLATAVKFDDPTLAGDYLMVDGEKYLICDPTYINSNIGMSMPDLRNTRVEVYK